MGSALSNFVDGLCVCASKLLTKQRRGYIPEPLLFFIQVQRCLRTFDQ